MSHYFPHPYPWVNEPFGISRDENGEDIIVEGSDVDDSPIKKAERTRARAAIGRAYVLNGHMPLVQSAQLKGPFTRESGWTNPWRRTGAVRQSFRSSVEDLVPVHNTIEADSIDESIIQIVDHVLGGHDRLGSVPGTWPAQQMSTTGMKGAVREEETYDGDHDMSEDESIPKASREKLNTLFSKAGTTVKVRSSTGGAGKGTKRAAENSWLKGAHLMKRPRNEDSRQESPTPVATTKRISEPQSTEEVPTGVDLYTKVGNSGLLKCGPAPGDRAISTALGMIAVGMNAMPTVPETADDETGHETIINAQTQDLDIPPINVIMPSGTARLLSEKQCMHSAGESTGAETDELAQSSNSGRGPNKRPTRKKTKPIQYSDAQENFSLPKATKKRQIRAKAVKTIGPDGSLSCAKSRSSLRIVHPQSLEPDELQGFSQASTLTSATDFTANPAGLLEETYTEGQSQFIELCISELDSETMSSWHKAKELSFQGALSSPYRKENLGSHKGTPGPSLHEHTEVLEKLPQFSEAESFGNPNIKEGLSSEKPVAVCNAQVDLDVLALSGTEHEQPTEPKRRRPITFSDVDSPGFTKTARERHIKKYGKNPRRARAMDAHRLLMDDEISNVQQKGQPQRSSQTQKPSTPVTPPSESHDERSSPLPAIIEDRNGKHALPTPQHQRGISVSSSQSITPSKQGRFAPHSLLTEKTEKEEIDDESCTLEKSITLEGLEAHMVEYTISFEGEDLNEPNSVGMETLRTTTIHEENEGRKSTLNKVIDEDLADKVVPETILNEDAFVFISERDTKPLSEQSLLEESTKHAEMGLDTTGINGTNGFNVQLHCQPDLPGNLAVEDLIQPGIYGDSALESEILLAEEGYFPVTKKLPNGTLTEKPNEALNQSPLLTQTQNVKVPPVQSPWTTDDYTLPTTAQSSALSFIDFKKEDNTMEKITDLVQQQNESQMGGATFSHPVEDSDGDLPQKRFTRSDKAIVDEGLAEEYLLRERDSTPEENFTRFRDLMTPSPKAQTSSLEGFLTTQNLIEAVTANPWTSSIRRPGGRKSKSRVSFGPPCETLQTDEVVDPTSKEDCSRRIASPPPPPEAQRLTPTESRLTAKLGATSALPFCPDSSTRRSEIDSSQRSVGAMAEMFMAADRQSTSCEPESRPLKHGDANGQNKRRLVAPVATMYEPERVAVAPVANMYQPQGTAVAPVAKMYERQHVPKSEKYASHGKDWSPHMSSFSISTSGEVTSNTDNEMEHVGSSMDIEANMGAVIDEMESFLECPWDVDMELDKGRREAEKENSHARSQISGLLA